VAAKYTTKTAYTPQTATDQSGLTANRKAASDGALRTASRD